jgi:hypothetical protein
MLQIVGAVTTYFVILMQFHSVFDAEFRVVNTNITATSVTF